MTPTDRRHIGRAIRRNRHRHPDTALAFVTIGLELDGFVAAIARSADAMRALDGRYRHPRQILDNGGKP